MAKVGLGIVVLLFAMNTISAQKHTPLPHGSTFGKRVDTVENMPASSLQTYMGKRTRISTTIHGRVLQVDKTKGGWFKLDAGNGKIISVHFSTYNITIPADLKGRDIMLQGIAQKLDKAGAKHKLSFEATGLTVL